jgi:benzoyl-CoA reductase/2-hydroxyglutaryl-CoA dehydratase subunit BcrC/BadD/HgdB
MADQSSVPHREPPAPASAPKATGGAPGGSPRLRTSFDIFDWYRRVKASGRPVAWCSAFAPAEALLALGIIPVYPENHAAILGALSESRDPQQPYSRGAIASAEAKGYAQPRLCSYALADLGTLDAQGSSPIGGLPEPDLFYACDSQCAVVARWGDEVQRHFRSRGVTPREIPHYVLHAPPLTRAEQHTPEELLGFSSQLQGHLADCAARFGLTWDLERLAEVVAESARANRLWQACLQRAQHRPTPWTSFDAFAAMAPIVVARGTPEATAYYQALLAELDERIHGGVAAVSGERVRLVWDAIPIWPRKNWLARFCAERGVAFVSSTYTHSWWFDFDARRPLESLVERYAWNTMNRSGRWVLDWTLGLVRDYHADGLVAHWNRSCGIWNSYVKRRLPGYASAGVPHVVVQADMVDARAFDEAAVSAQLEAFFAQLTPAR